MHHAGRNVEHSCVPFGLNNTLCGFILKEIDWGRKHPIKCVEHSCVPFNHNNTLCGFILKEIDWGGKHPINSLVDWQSHETYRTGHNISEVDWGALHDSSFFLFLVNIDYDDAKPKDFFTQELWGGLPERTSSTTLRSLNHVEEKLVHHLELQKGASRLDHHLYHQRDATSSPYRNMCPNPSLSLAITMFMVGHSYYFWRIWGET